MNPSDLQFYIEEWAVEAGITFLAPRAGDAGFDIRAAEALTVAVGEKVAVKTGLHLAIPLGWVGIVKDRSSVASKGVYSHGGVIDASYRGEVKVLLSNRGDAPFTVTVGDRVAQLVVVQHLSTCREVSTLEDLGSTERGAAGFGSTGQ